MRSRLNSPSSSSDILFWASTSFFLFLVIWSVTFEIDKSVNVQGDLSPLGRPIVVQNRFEGKVLELLVSSGDQVTAGQDLVIFETSADDSEFLENRVESQKLSIQLRRLIAQSKLEEGFELFEEDDAEFSQDQLRVLLAEVGTLQSQIKSKETNKFYKLKFRVRSLKFLAFKKNSCSPRKNTELSINYFRRVMRDKLHC